MAHNLYLGMYTFSVKRKHTKNTEIIDNNELLEACYPELDNNKFEKGFAQDLISLLDKKAYKNEDNTHGATLDSSTIKSKERILDILIDGGITGIKQYIIKEKGVKDVLSDKDIVGPKFYARIWLPASTKTGYIFIQKYGGMSIKPIFDSLMKELLDKYELSLFKQKLSPTTTKVRLKRFLKHAALKDITIVSRSSQHSTGEAEASTVEVRLKNFKLLKETKDQLKIELNDIKKALGKHGFKIGNKQYDIKGTLEYDHGNNTKEERTTSLDNTDETINIVPNILISEDCIDKDNYPIFEKMKKLVDEEMKQIRKEAKE